MAEIDLTHGSGSRATVYRFSFGCASRPGWRACTGPTGTTPGPQLPGHHQVVCVSCGGTCDSAAAT